jgi:hypothetical protein
VAAAHRERDGAVQVGGLELGHELRSAVDLDGLDGPWHLSDHFVEEVSGVRGGRLCVGLGPFGEPS